jgi:DNA-binding NarL/FixJ family response regulator
MSNCVALIDDLIFATKIRSTAAGLGVGYRAVRSASDIQELTDGSDVQLVIIDLEMSGVDVAAAVDASRALNDRVRVVAFGSHVNKRLLESAVAAGVDDAWPRSRFNNELPSLLRSIAG